jgi:hypothetical protein
MRTLYCVFLVGNFEESDHLKYRSYGINAADWFLIVAMIQMIHALPRLPRATLI